MQEVAELQRTIEGILPPGCSLERLELEGQDVVLYIRGLKEFYAAENPVKAIATAIKKKVLIRGAERVDAETARGEIEKVVPPEAGVKEIAFSEKFGEVVITALKPGLAIGKGAAVLKEIAVRTGWTPRILRWPTMPSTVVPGIRALLLHAAEDRKKFLARVARDVFAPARTPEVVRLSALGGFREVGRSCALIETDSSKILIDCGVNPELLDPERAFPVFAKAGVAVDDVDAVVLTHAHLDHCGFVPALIAMGYDGPIYATAPTRDLMGLLCFDFIKVLRRSAKEPLYGEKDVRKALARTITREYGEVTDIAPDCKLVLHNAGHILGSAMAHLHIGSGVHNLVYTGDFKFGPTRTFAPAATTFPRCDTLITEATYGARGDVHPPRPAAEAQLAEVIAQTVARGGKALIPVFSVGRSQEVMLVLEEAVRKGALPEIKVWLDGMVLEATAIHTCYPEFLKAQLERAILSDRSPFESEIFELVRGERAEVVEGPPCVILAPSGMLSGGPALEYLQLLAQDPKNALIFVGYQAVGTLGYKIQRGDKEVAILDEGGRLKSVRIEMQTATCEGFSGHSDVRQLMSFVHNIRPRPKQIFTVHGDESKCPELAMAITRFVHIEARAPRNLDCIRLA